MKSATSFASFFQTRVQWYRDAAKPVGELPEDGDGGDPARDYVLSGDMARDAADDLDRLLAENVRLNALINNPHTDDFLEAVRTEAAHQIERWGPEHDARKEPSDWFWVIGYVAGKALSKPDKRLHHIITTAAVCLNWHAHETGNR